MARGTYRDLRGLKFGRLTVLSPERAVNGRMTWRCLCDCGIEKVVIGRYLTDGNTHSCGCLRRDKVRVQGYKAVAKRSHIGILQLKMGDFDDEV